ncbi:expressed hypothetical protein [Trichoplax adhaerens]|uniref:26S proteasome non-ATPase regulatory subunit 8 n=1 Tax=Trichoplax adhaerens TaxID=10228 RepID=B3SAL4_TRIAD|nr:expressed hypothetical protein [Trichoplax adhaerens]EDV20279.1 expressed hypothetical protein [Trichoplax adhaerens]|eukprot:XP_002117229.1 expressed hypothetical protein [Trichoplax adhaerens]
MAPDNFSNVLQNFNTLNKEWHSARPDLAKCGSLLTQLKIALATTSLLPTDKIGQDTDTLVVARGTLEIGAQWSIAKKDIQSFQRYMTQLKPYYIDYSDILPESPYMYQLLGLNLLALLAENRLAEFHIELELLPPSEIYSNIYIKHPTTIEQYLMEGSYNKVFLARGNVPAESYNFFMDILVNTMRDSIADCAEKAYKTLLFKEAGRIFFFDNQRELEEYTEKRGWKTDPSKTYYTLRENDENHEADVFTVNTNKISGYLLEYAREMEKIV